MNFKWFGADKTLSSLGFMAEVGIFVQNEKIYIPGNINPPQDKLIFDAIPVYDLPVNETNLDWTFSILYETELVFMKRGLERLTGLTLKYNPRYISKISLMLNRFIRNESNYGDLIAKDTVLFDNTLNSNLHANVQGIIDLRLAYEIYRNANIPQLVSYKVFSFQITFGAKILF